MKILDKLKKDLEKTEKQLSKYHAMEDRLGIHNNSTMRKAKIQINIEYYCKEKFRLQGEIEAINELNQYKLHE